MVIAIVTGFPLAQINITSYWIILIASYLWLSPFVPVSCSSMIYHVPSTPATLTSLLSLPGCTSISLWDSF